MSVINSSILVGASGAATSYSIDQSCRFTYNDEGALSRTPGSDGDRKTWTASFWVKRGKAGMGEYTAFFGGGVDANNRDVLRFNTSNQLNAQLNVSGSSKIELNSTRLFRDFGSWMHIVYALDTTETSSSDRVKVWVDNELIAWEASGLTYPDEDDESLFNAANLNIIGARVYPSVANAWYDGYMAEFHFIDGQALTPASFAEVNEDTNQWVAKEVIGMTYGTNGFYLKFEDSGTLGNDSSGNNNDFASANLVASDQMPDSPTNNFCTWSPMTNDGKGQVIDDGNLEGKTDGYTGNGSTFLLPKTGKWYAEFRAQTLVATTGMFFGVADPRLMFTTSKMYDNPVPCAVYRNNGLLIYTGDNSTSTDYASFTDGDIIGVAVDVDADEIWFAKDNTWQGSGSPNPSTGTAGHDLTTGTRGEWVMIYGSGDTDDELGRANFGADSTFAGAETAQNNADANGRGDFYYAPPTNFLALCENNLPTPSIEKAADHYNTLLWDGDGASSRSITGLGLQADMMWTKLRDETHQHNLVDRVRGVDERFIYPDTTAAEDYGSGSLSQGWIDSLDSDGLTVTYGSASGWNVNNATGQYAAWSWKGGGNPTVDNSAGAGATPTADSVKIDGSNLGSALAGTLAATRLSANTTNGFSIITYTGSGGAATVAHGLSAAPELLIVKSRSATGAWGVGASEDQYSSWTQYSILDTAAAISGSGGAGFWNDTPPTSSVFSIKDATETNVNTVTYVAYAFQSIDGYSKVATYTGNGDPDGIFAYLNFRPAFLLIKGNASADWHIFDSKRIGYNVKNYDLTPNENSAESTDVECDLLSNGFKIRTNAANINGDAVKYLFYAVAEFPFKYANAR